MNKRDDWPDEILEGALEAVAGEESEERRSAEQIARDVRNMNAVLSAMGERLGGGMGFPRWLTDRSCRCGVGPRGGGGPWWRLRPPQPSRR